MYAVVCSRRLILSGPRPGPGDVDDDVFICWGEAMRRDPKSKESIHRKDGRGSAMMKEGEGMKMTCLRIHQPQTTTETPHNHIMMKFLSILLALLLTTLVKGFVPSSSSARQGSLLYSTAEEVSIEPKDVVKLFGRLAEKYIMLDESGGMCCYSACKDCEYRLPGGGYKMADQSAARPKWIPVYEERNFAGQNKEHKTKWSTEIFSEGPSVTKEEFVQALTELQYAPPCT